MLIPPPGGDYLLEEPPQRGGAGTMKFILEIERAKMNETSLPQNHF